MARPTGPKVTGLTGMNVDALTAAQQAGILPAEVKVTATTAAWPYGVNAATAAAQVVSAIDAFKAMDRPENKSHAHSLHAVRRKLERQARPGEKVQPPAPAAPKASKRLAPKDCDHAQREGDYRLTAGPAGGRVKCLCCGLIVDDAPPVKATGKATRRRSVHDSPALRPARPGQGGVTTAQVVPAAQAAAAPQNGTRAAQDDARQYASILHGDAYLVVSLGDGIQPGEVVATCANPVHAHQLVVALNAGRG